MLKFSVALIAGALAVSPAMALTYVGSNGGNAPATGAGSLLAGDEIHAINFNDASCVGLIGTCGPSNLSGNGHIAFASTTGWAANPGGGAADPNDKYLSVPDNFDNGVESASFDFVGYDFGGTVTGFSFFWGSLDNHNTLTVKTNQTTSSWTGSQITASPNGDWSNDLMNRRVYFTLGANETLEGLTFTSTNYAFETDDFSFVGISAVPETSTWAMMILGMGGIGHAMRSRRKLKPNMVAA